MSELIDNIYRVVKGEVKITEDQANEFGKTLSDLIADRLNGNTEKRPFTLRMSNIGKGARQLWYEKHYGDTEGERFSGKTLLKFLYGDLIEHLVLFLASVSGHRVSDCQAEVALSGVKGHIDADIDGVTTDVKSASPHAFRKFKDGTLVENDPFGYIEQLSGYSKARDTDGAFLAVDKVSGEIAHLQFSKDALATFKVEDRIEYLKGALDSPEPPDRCYPDEPFQDSGNRALGVNCSYCAFNKRCWSDANNGLGLRTFNYSKGPVFMTHVAKEPKVHEITF